MKNKIPFLLMCFTASGTASFAQLSEAKFTTGSSVTVTSTVDDAPFRVAVRDNASAMNGYIDIGPQNPNWAHFVTDRSRFYMNQPLFINNVGASGNGSVLSSYNALSLVLGTGDLNAVDATPYYVPRLTITQGGEHIYGHVNGQRWRIDPRTGNSGDFFNLGYDDAAGTFNTEFSIMRSGNVPKIAVGLNYGTMNSTFNIITRTPLGQSGSSVLALKFGEPGTGNVSLGHWEVYLHADASTNNTRCNMSFKANGTDQVMALFNNGDVSISQKLTCREVLVSNNVPWPDYVFGNDYKLRSLGEVESYITTNNHLPDVPSAAEIKNQGGANLGEMNTILLRKIEELTLYAIDQQKTIDAMKTELAELKSARK